MSVISLKNISRVYGFGSAMTMALDDVTLDIQKGEFVAIMGPSGSGKSTLMNLVGMLDRPSHGEYVLDGQKVSGLSQRKLAKMRRDKIGFVFQSFNLLNQLTAIDNVALPLTYGGMAHTKRMHRAEEVLISVGLKERQYYMPTQLSGGQVQRVAVARALVNKPAIVLADEPTGNLDTTSSIKIMELLKEIHENGNTIVMVTHNPELAQYAERFVMLRDGKIEADTDDPKEMLKLVVKNDQKAVARAKKELEQASDSFEYSGPSKESKKDRKPSKKKSKRKGSKS